MAVRVSELNRSCPRTLKTGNPMTLPVTRRTEELEQAIGRRPSRP